MFQEAAKRVQLGVLGVFTGPLLGGLDVLALHGPGGELCGHITGLGRRHGTDRTDSVAGFSAVRGAIREVVRHRTTGLDT